MPSSLLGMNLRVVFASMLRINRNGKLLRTNERRINMKSMNEITKMKLLTI